MNSYAEIGCAQSGVSFILFRLEILQSEREGLCFSTSSFIGIKVHTATYLQDLERHLVVSRSPNKTYYYRRKDTFQTRPKVPDCKQRYCTEVTRDNKLSSTRYWPLRTTE